MRLSRKILSSVALLTLSIAGAASAGRVPDAGGPAASSAAAGRDNYAAGGQVVDVDLELVLAIDVSDSMSVSELEEQRNGYAAAFRHPELFAAIASGELGRIAVTYVEWAGPHDQTIALPWAIITNADDAIRFAGQLAALPLKPDRPTPPWLSGTSISNALLFAAGLFPDNGITALRQAIDVSGDGPNNSGLPIELARDDVIGQGITINGLPLILGRRGLPIDRYYEDCVIGGAGSFSITVSDASDFAVAIRHKLVLEIASREPAEIAVAFKTVAPGPSPEFCDRWHRGMAGFPAPSEDR